MRVVIVLTALICGLVASNANAEKEGRVKMVPTVIGLTISDLSGQLLSSPDSVFYVVWDQFGKNPWPEEYRATMVIDSRVGQALAPTRFPIDPGSLWYVKAYAKFFHRPRITIGFYVLDGHRRPIQCSKGVRIVIWQLGHELWPQDLWVKIEGALDERGHIVVPVHFPLTGVVVKNLTTLARTQEQ